MTQCQNCCSTNGDILIYMGHALKTVGPTLPIMHLNNLNPTLDPPPPQPGFKLHTPSCNPCFIFFSQNLQVQANSTQVGHWYFLRHDKAPPEPQILFSCSHRLSGVSLSLKTTWGRWTAPLNSLNERPGSSHVKTSGQLVFWDMIHRYWNIN